MHYSEDNSAYAWRFSLRLRRYGFPIAAIVIDGRFVAICGARKQYNNWKIGNWKREKLMTNEVRNVHEAAENAVTDKQSVWGNTITLDQSLNHAVASGKLSAKHKESLLQHFTDLGVDIKKVLIPVTKGVAEAVVAGVTGISLTD